jgi:opacity protein-like surface antigen
MKKTSLFLCLFPALLAAQSFEGAVSGGVSALNSKDLGSGYTLDNGFRLTFRMTINTKEHSGYEFGYAYNRTHLGTTGADATGMGAHQVFGDYLLYATKQESRIRPFVAGGLQFTNFVPPGQSGSYGQGEMKYGFNYGGGVKMRITGPWHFRVDVRQFNQGKPFGLGGSGRLLQNEISVGVGYWM